MLVLLVTFLLIYSELSFHSYQNGVPLFNSPDETANYFFSKQFAEKKILFYNEQLSQVSSGYVHPRSMTAVGDRISPVGFLGLPVLYGSLARVFGTGSIPFFTPAIASIAALFFYILVKNIFSKRIGMIAMLLFLIHPAYLYNANRAMLPNVLFADLLIIGCALASCCGFTKKKMHLCVLGFFSGAMIGLSLWVRFSEIPWVLGFFALFWLVHIRKISLYSLSSFIIGLIIPLGLMAYYNTSVYGNPMLFGYQTPALPHAVFRIEQTGMLLQTFLQGNVGTAISHIRELFSSLKAALLPFGVQPLAYQKTFIEYVIVFFLPFSILALFGFFFAVKNALVKLIFEKKTIQCVWILGTLALSAWLIVFYGSWVFYDNLNREVTIGTSYIRYWLPIFLFSLPFSAAGLAYAYEHARGIMSKFFVISALFSLGFFSFALAFSGPTESIDAMKREVASYHTKRAKVMQATPEDAVIVSARSDKIFFPARRVAEQTSDFREVEIMKKILKDAPVYYYGLWGKDDAQTISKKYFTSHGLTLEFAADIDEREHLYKMVVQK